MTSVRTAAIHQPHYFPWIPYMNKLAASDVFVLYDTVQLPRGKCRELRTKYLFQGQEKWLTIPAGKAKSAMAPERDVRLESLAWKAEHLAKLQNAYAKAPHRDWALDLVAECLGPDDSHFLVDIHHRALAVLTERLGLGTTLVRASELAPYEDVALQEYVVDLVRAVDAGRYLTGMGRGSAKTVDEELFVRAGVELVYQDYAIPAYPQLGVDEFVPSVSVLDALFMVGPDAAGVILGPGEGDR